MRLSTDVCSVLIIAVMPVTSVRTDTELMFAPVMQSRSSRMITESCSSDVLLSLAGSRTWKSDTELKAMIDVGPRTPIKITVCVCVTKTSSSSSSYRRVHSL